MQGRWEKAQKAEKTHTTHHSMAKKDEALSKLKNFDLDLSDFDGSRVLAVGGGTGMIHALSNAEFAISIDPITLSKKDTLNESSAQLITGVGEYVPFQNNYFDYVICYNVLDHTFNPGNVLNEIRRVLSDDGELLFKLNTYEIPNSFLNRLSLIDRPHLHHYSRNSILEFVSEHGFSPTVTKYQRRSYQEYGSFSVKKFFATLFLRWGQIWFTATLSDC